MEEKKREIEIDMNKLIIRVHNKIAIWNNQNATGEEKSIMLKVLSHDIVSDIISSAFSGLDGIKTKEKIVVGKPKKNSFIKNLFRAKE